MCLCVKLDRVLKFMEENKRYLSVNFRWRFYFYCFRGVLFREWFFVGFGIRIWDGGREIDLG